MRGRAFSLAREGLGQQEGLLSVSAPNCRGVEGHVHVDVLAYKVCEESIDRDKCIMFTGTRIGSR